MNFLIKYQSNSWLLQVNPQVWMLGVCRFISQLGTGFTLFYTTIFFVNKVGFSPTAVGLALGSAAISGVLGRILVGSMGNSQFWGRRSVLLLSATINAIASLVFAVTNHFPTLLLGNLLIGLGQGLYWPAIDTVTADLAPSEQCRETVALMRVMDYVGLGIGIVIGGEVIGVTGAYRALFALNAITFLMFFGLVYVAVAEPERRQSDQLTSSVKGSWTKALGDRRFLVYVLVNIIFIIYSSELQTTLPLYLKNFASATWDLGHGFSETTISTLFAWHIGLATVCQLPIARALNRLSHAHALIFSALMWATGFGAVWMTGFVSTGHLVWAILALEIFAIAAVSYAPAAIAIVTSLAPPSQRSIYFSINSLCGSVGYFIGPPLGSWAIEQSPFIADYFWLCLALSVIVTIVILQYLHHLLLVRGEG